MRRADAAPPGTPRRGRDRAAALLVWLALAAVPARAQQADSSAGVAAERADSSAQFAPQRADSGAGAAAQRADPGARASAPAESEADRNRNAVGGSGPSTLVYPPYNHTYGIHKARTPHLKLFLAGRTVFSDPQGLAAVKLAQDDDPSQKSDDFQLTLLGLNAGRGEIIYNSSMQTLAMFGTQGSREGQFDAPRGIAADVNGKVYVADSGNRRVVRLVWRDRQLVWTGLVKGDFQEPWGVATAPAGDQVYITDRRGDQVYRWTPPADSGGGDGELVAVFPEGLRRPTAVAVLDSREEWLSPREDALYVIYEDGARLGKFDPAGKLLAETAAAERDSLSAAPRFAYLACDFYGNVYVTDTGNGTIYKFKRDLTYLTRYGEQGEGDFQLMEPRGIAIWKRFGQVFVAEKDGAQYFFVGTDILLPDGPLPMRISGSGPTKGYEFEAFFTDPTELAIEFLAEDGAVVDSLKVPGTLESGAAQVSIAGVGLSPDLEQRASRIVLEPRPTYSSRKRFARRMERPIEWVQAR
ncbi:MAG TPA: NHL repeat-containing protein [Gemmatimonadota bacterium]